MSEAIGLECKGLRILNPIKDFIISPFVIL